MDSRPLVEEFDALFDAFDELRANEETKASFMESLPDPLVANLLKVLQSVQEKWGITPETYAQYKGYILLFAYKYVLRLRGTAGGGYDTEIEAHIGHEAPVELLDRFKEYLSGAAHVSLSENIWGRGIREGQFRAQGGHSEEGIVVHPEFKEGHLTRFVIFDQTHRSTLNIRFLDEERLITTMRESLTRVREKREDTRKRMENQQNQKTRIDQVIGTLKARYGKYLDFESDPERGIAFIEVKGLQDPRELKQYAQESSKVKWRPNRSASGFSIWRESLEEGFEVIAEVKKEESQEAVVVSTPFTPDKGDRTVFKAFVAKMVELLKE